MLYSKIVEAMKEKIAQDTKVMFLSRIIPGPVQRKQNPDLSYKSAFGCLSNQNIYLFSRVA